MPFQKNELRLYKARDKNELDTHMFYSALLQIYPVLNSSFKLVDMAYRSVHIVIYRTQIILDLLASRNINRTV